MIDRDWSRVPVVGVSRLASYVRRKLESDPKLATLGVEGEITNLRVQASGTWNFDVKEREAVLACFAFASDAATFPELKNGAAVVVYGRVSIFEKRSSYQLVVRHCELAGVGALYARFEALRKKLDAEGLFRAERKRPIPQYPFRVALVGSPSGDGTRDFRTQAAARAPHVEVRLFATPVQGDVAPQIVAALRQAYAANPDLVVVARGGGSFEDLFVFNDERVVREIANAPIPVATAIGHESNTSLADYAASHQAPTPSTAAQTLLPPRDELLRTLRRDGDRLARALDGRLHRLRSQLDRIERRSPLADPTMLLAGRRQRLDALAVALDRAAQGKTFSLRRRLVDLERRFNARSPAARVASWRARFDALRPRLSTGFVVAKRIRTEDLAVRLNGAAARTIDRDRQRLAVLAASLGPVDPRAPLRRGFAIVRRPGGEPLEDPADAPAGTRLRIEVARGELTARVEPEGKDGGEQIGLF
ncbi:MAG TPA: exodeoxyribonuclease VII large subunit [Candidatus Elarobacter sp.]